MRVVSVGGGGWGLGWEYHRIMLKGAAPFEG